MAEHGRPDSERASVAVIGSGVAGLMAAYVISNSAEVTLIEAAPRLGGHSDTHRVPTVAGELAIDTGFIVHNDRTYPTLLRLFRELGVRTQPAEMSMSVRADHSHRGTGLEYAGAKGLKGLFGSPRNLLRPDYLRMLFEVPRFHRSARRLLQATPSPENDLTLGEFLERNRFSQYFIEYFMKPLVATVWSCDERVADRYPVRYLLRFLDHHGMLSISDSPQWRTLVGGSASYVRRINDHIVAQGGTVETGNKVTSIRSLNDGVELADERGRTRHFDRAVIATHPDQALQMLSDPTADQRRILAAIGYSRNQMQLHTDTSLLPARESVRASWNHLSRPTGQGVAVTYDLTRLMNLPSPDGTRYLASLNAADLVDPDQVIATREYSHPIYTPEAVAAIESADELDSDRLSFAGAWRGWGFHEDGARTGLSAAERLGFRWTHGPEPATTPRIYETSILHARTVPVRYSFRHRSRIWLIDLDCLPRHGRLRAWFLGSFRASDHLGRPGLSIRQNVEELLAENGIDTTAGGRILMAAMPRAYGHCFNPLTVFWCYDGENQLAATVLEVQNTYGGRHPYVLRPDRDGNAKTAKAMYVSPFHGTDGHYEIRVPEPTADRLDVAVTLCRPGGYRFHAALQGHPSPVGALKAGPASLLGSLAIRFHGIRLFLKRVPITPRLDPEAPGR